MVTENDAKMVPRIVWGRRNFQNDENERKLESAWLGVVVVVVSLSSCATGGEEDEGDDGILLLSEAEDDEGEMTILRR